jgi:hypothetical protein
VGPNGNLPAGMAAAAQAVWRMNSLRFAFIFSGFYKPEFKVMHYLQLSQTGCKKIAKRLTPNNG